MLENFERCQSEGDKFFIHWNKSGGSIPPSPRSRRLCLFDNDIDLSVTMHRKITIQSIHSENIQSFTNQPKSGRLDFICLISSWHRMHFQVMVLWSHICESMQMREHFSAINTNNVLQITCEILLNIVQLRHSSYFIDSN
jgi:hypothetical protein